MTAADPIAGHFEPTPTVIVRRDVLERLQVSVVHATIHHQCRTLSRDAMRAYEALDREDAARFMEEYAATWLEYQRLQVPAVTLLEELAEHVERCNGFLESIKELLGRPDAPVQDRRGVFYELFTSTTRLAGMTRAMSLRVLADLNEMIDQAGLAEPAGADVMPFRNRRPSGIEDVMDRDTAQEPAAGNAPAPVAPLAQLRGKSQRDAVDTSSESGSRNRLSNPVDLAIEVLQPIPRKSQKEPPDGSTP